MNKSHNRLCFSLKEKENKNTEDVVCCFSGSIVGFSFLLFSFFSQKKKENRKTEK